MKIIVVITIITIIITIIVIIAIISLPEGAAAGLTRLEKPAAGTQK